MKISHNIYITIWALLLLACSSGSNKMMSPNWMTMNKNGDKLFIADETANRISIINTTDSKVLSHIDLAEKPSGLTLSPDESKAYVTLAAPQGKLIEIDLVSQQVSRSLEVGHTPIAPVLSSNGQTLYLCDRFDNDICSIDLKSFTIKKKNDCRPRAGIYCTFEERE